MDLPNNAGTIINIGLILILLFLMYKGYKKGFITQVVGLFSLLAAAIIAWILYVPFGSLFKVVPKTMVPFQNTNLHEFFYTKVNAMLWFIIIFITAFIIIKFVTKILDLISKAPFINLVNRVLGLAFSLINFILIVWLLIFALSTPLFTNGDEVIENSLLKYNQPLLERLDSIVLNKPIEQLKATQQIIKMPNQASEKDILNMQDWLVKNKVSLSDVSDFFKEIKGE